MSFVKIFTQCCLAFVSSVKICMQLLSICEFCENLPSVLLSIYEFCENLHTVLLSICAFFENLHTVLLSICEFCENLHTVLLSICELCENRRREGRTFIMAVYGTTFYALTI
jgi:hypothetical protein